MLTAAEMHEQSLRSTAIADCADRGWRIVLTCSTCGHGGGSYAAIDIYQLRSYPADMSMKEGDQREVQPLRHKGAWIDHRQQGTKQMP
jgi:hypothetical protein